MLPAVPGLRIVRCLGHGGMGAVYLAVDRHHRSLALKVIDAGDTIDPFVRERFEREIAAVSALRHANIVRFVRAGTVAGSPYALFERVRGRSLAEIGPQPWPVVVGLGQQLARATAAVHAAGWLHRDLKLSNAMVGDHGLVTLIDFGLAKRWFDHDGRRRPSRPADPVLTVRGTIVGTPRYLAPETRRGVAAEPATDVYSLGLALHELLGGPVDPEGQIGARPAHVPAALDALVVAALDTDPRRRPSAASLAAMLEELPAIRGSFRRVRFDRAPTWPPDADRLSTRCEVPVRRAG